MAYVDQGIDQRAEVLLGKQDTLTFFVKAGGKLQTIDATDAFVTIYDPSGIVVVPRTAATVPAPTTAGKLTYTRTWEGTTPALELSEDYVAEWEYRISGADHTDRQFFDVVRTKLPCLIDVNNLADYYPDIVQHLLAVGELDADKFCRRAWSLMLDRIRSGHNRPSLILDRSRLVNPALCKALELATNALSKDISDVWFARSNKHRKDYADAMAGLGELKYDRDEDGLAANGETKRINRRRFSV